LGNLCVIVDWNGSAAQLMPRDELVAKWRAFGWQVSEIDGHDANDLQRVFASMTFEMNGNPKAVLAHTVKGKGVSFVHGHGLWHHRIPSDQELAVIMKELS
jgi:transketolase